MHLASAVLCIPVDDRIAVEMLQRLEQGHGNLQNHPALAHGAPFIQQTVQEIAASTVLHDQENLVCVLKCPVELRDQRHPAEG